MAYCLTIKENGSYLCTAVEWSPRQNAKLKGKTQNSTYGALPFLEEKKREMDTNEYVFVWICINGLHKITQEAGNSSSFMFLLGNWSWWREDRGERKISHCTPFCAFWILNHLSQLPILTKIKLQTWLYILDYPYGKLIWLIP